MSRVPLSREPTAVRIDGFTHGGEGVARIEGKAVFVPGTIPGERVVVRVVDDRKRWARARLVEVLEPSPDRLVPPCPYLDPTRTAEADPARPHAGKRRPTPVAPICGGCDLQHIAPDRQRTLKTRVVIEQLQRLGGIAMPPVAATRAVGPATGYRNRARFHADATGRLGFHAPGSHDVVAVDRCLVLAPAAQQVRDAVGDATGASEVGVHGHATTGAAAAVLRPGPGALDLPAGDFDLVLTQPDGAAMAMRGDGVLSEEVAGFRYRFDATGFFQVSADGAHALVEEVLAAAGDVGGALVWDLYAGVGLFSLPLAARGATVVAVEGDASAAGWAGRNAEASGVDLTVAAAAVEDFVTARPDDGLPDVVVLDPPRSGAGAKVTRALADLEPHTIVTVACDVAALARDARTLAEDGYQLRSAQPLDLFPHTHHVEVVARFAR